MARSPARRIKLLAVGLAVIALGIAAGLAFVAQRSPTTGVHLAVVGGIVVALGLVLVSALLPALALWWRSHRFPADHCPRCGYDLTGNRSGRCPECGHESDPPDWSARAPGRTI